MSVSINGTTGWTFSDATTQNTGGYTGFRNRIINGDMRIDQRNAGASISGTSGNFAVDRFEYSSTQSGKVTLQQNSGSVTPPAGFKNYLGVVSSSAYSVLSTDIFKIRQHVEGFNVADLNWGTANAATVTLSFWVRSSLIGLFGGALLNQGETRSYPFSYTINSANTWEQKTITIAGDQSGTWATDNGIGIRVTFGLGIGSTYSSTAGSWSGTRYESVTGATSIVGTSGATFYITGVQLEKGSVATPFEFRPYGTELQLCMRYYENGPSFVGVYMQSTTAGKISGEYRVPKRSNASISAVSGGRYLAQYAGSTINSGGNTSIGSVSFLVINGCSNVNGFGADFTISTSAGGTGFVYLWNNPYVPFWAASSEL